jgi:hypothetical protein
MASFFHRRQILGVATAVSGAALAAWLLFPHRGARGPTADSGAVSRSLSASAADDEAPLAGSASCRECHAVFFEKWSTSFHGRAMQPHTGEFARDRLTPQRRPLRIKGRLYRAVVGTGSDHVEEKGPDGTREYPIAQVLGGKNVSYFLTPLARGHVHVVAAEPLREGGRDRLRPLPHVERPASASPTVPTTRASPATPRAWPR